MELLGHLFSKCIEICYGFVNNYVVAIVLFTVFTKIILFPISLWTQRNGIKMVEITPELNRVKIKYYGDKDSIAEETQRLYKREHYHPLLSLVPMFIQIILLMGVISAVRQLLSGNEGVLSTIPVQGKGLLFLIPVAAGAASLVLGLAQNHLNPLQREQSFVGQWSTNGLSIAISLILGAFVPVGVGIYWIASNLLTIFQQIALNIVVPPKKYIDYKALAESKQELDGMNSLSSNVSREDKQRERADYKRFFSVANKHLVFYSESSGFYKYFQNIIEYLLGHSNVIIHYITSDPKDQIFGISQKEPRIKAYYIGEKRLITLMMKMDADIVAMTVPDLENYHIKRSYIRKDIEYVYIYHGLFGGLETLRKGALDHFDTLLVPTPGVESEMKGYNKKYHLPDQKMIPCGYGVIDNMAVAYEKMKKEEHRVKKILIAPSWQKDNILESCIHDLVEPLLQKGYDVTVRPHPQYIRRFPQRLQEIIAECDKYDKTLFRFQLDFSSNETVYLADVLVTDWSGIGYEYAVATKKPVMFINTPRKRVNEDWTDEDISLYSIDRDIRDVVGVSLLPDDVRDRAAQTVERMISEREKWDRAIEEVRQKRMYNFGESGKYGGKYLIGQIIEKQKNVLKKEEPNK